jgi:hypothetical protein
VTWLIVFPLKHMLEVGRRHDAFTASHPSMIFSSEMSFTAPPTGFVCFQNLLRCLAPLQKISELPFIK